MKIPTCFTIFQTLFYENSKQTVKKTEVMLHKLFQHKSGSKFLQPPKEKF